MNNKMNGKGILIRKEDFYIGDNNENEAHGFGIWTFHSQSVYIG
jgi:hypothetical protein